VSAFAAQFLRELVAIFREASPYILLGFGIAACVHVLLPVRTVQRFLGRGRLRSVVMAALLGIPLPLCSCAVVPTALALRRRGASRGATVSFLISTPETGEEAIALTWGLIDPLMAIFRPIAALLTAITAGVAVEVLGEGRGKPKPGEEGPLEGTPPEGPPPADEADPAATGSVWERLRRGFRGSFVELFDETSYWMLAGLVISALISVAVPAEVVTRWLSSGPLPLVVMLLVGIPLYICASGSTPIAAALMMKGLSPGAAFVFLLAGPATNVGSIGILRHALGRSVTIIYVASIAVLALAFGTLLDALYPALGIDPRASAGEMTDLPGWLAWPCVAGFAALLFFSFRRAAPPAEFRAIGSALGRLGLRLDRRFAAVCAVAVAAAWLLGSCFVVVPPGHRALVRRFGVPLGDVRGEGLHFKLPAPVDRADVFAADAVRRFELGFRSGGLTSAPADTLAGAESRLLEEEGVYLTGDENLLSTKSIVQYRVTDPERWVYGFRDPEDVLKLNTLSAAVDILAGYGIDRVYGGDRGEVEARILETLRARVREMEFGAEVLHYCIVDVHAPAEVHAAFRDVASAHEDKQTAINVAWRYLDETVNLAQGEAASEVEKARSESETSVLRAEGDSRSFVARAEAFRQRRVGTLKRLYLETAEEVLVRARKIVRPGWKGSSGIDLWISDGPVPAPVSDVIRGGDVRERQSRQQAEETSPPEEEEQP
jgi:HflK protein